MLISVPNDFSAHFVFTFGFRLRVTVSFSDEDWVRREVWSSGFQTVRRLHLRQRSAFPSSNAGTTPRNHIRSGWSKSCAQVDNPKLSLQRTPRTTTTASHCSWPQTEEWGARWNRDTESRHILLQEVQSLKQKTLFTTPRDWTAESVRHTLSSKK